jgi:hypothetical protein
VHSRCSRTLHDLPLCDQTLKLVVRVRKFFCDNGTCPRRIFAEQFSGLAQHRARRTNRLNNSVTRIALAVGGEGGGRLAKALNFGKWLADRRASHSVGYQTNESDMAGYHFLKVLNSSPSSVLTRIWSRR